METVIGGGAAGADLNDSLNIARCRVVLGVPLVDLMFESVWG